MQLGRRDRKLQFIEIKCALAYLCHDSGVSVQMAKIQEMYNCSDILDTGIEASKLMVIIPVMFSANDVSTTE